MSVILTIVMIIVTVVAIAYYLVKKFSYLFINAILGLLLLLIINYFHLMSYIGKPDLGYSLATVLICAIGGIPGVVILVLLSMLGITV
jgi:inhibitor of the pro-sigma K processing machinery